jgi:hypothetical protein
LTSILRVSSSADRRLTYRAKLTINPSTMISNATVVNISTRVNPPRRR